MEEKVKFIYLDENTTDGDKTWSTYGTQLDLKRHGIDFEEGKRYWFYHDFGVDNNDKDDPLVFTGIAHFDSDKDRWFVVIDEGSGQRYSESKFRDEYTIEDIQGPPLDLDKIR